MKVKLALAFVLFNALDIALTLYLVGHGVSTELNPIMARVLTFPLPLVLTYKILVPAVLVVIILILSRQPILRRISWTTILTLLVAGEASICLFNTAGLIWR